MKPGQGPTDDELDEIMEAEILETEAGVLIAREGYRDDVPAHRYKRDRG